MGNKQRKKGNSSREGKVRRHQASSGNRPCARCRRHDLLCDGYQRGKACGQCRQASLPCALNAIPTPDPGFVLHEDMKQIIGFVEAAKTGLHAIMDGLVTFVDETRASKVELIETIREITAESEGAFLQVAEIMQMGGDTATEALERYERATVEGLTNVEL